MDESDRSLERRRNATPRGEPHPPASHRETAQGAAFGPGTECDDGTCRTNLTEEYVTANETPVQEGEVRIRKDVEKVLQHLEVDASHDEVSIEHLPVNQAVSQRRKPWQEDDAIILPVYEEEIVVTRQLILKEKLRIRRVKVTERKHLTEEVRRERPVVEQIGRRGVVHELRPTHPEQGSPTTDH